MDIVVKFKKIWGKELFYPVSKDAFFLAEIVGRPTLLKRQLRLCLNAGWNVSIEKESVELEELLK